MKSDKRHLTDGMELPNQDKIRTLREKETYKYLGILEADTFLKWTREELKQMDQRTRKLMIMHKALHHRDDVNRLYVSRKGRGRGISCIEDSVDASIQRLEDYIEKHEGGLITAIKNDTDSTKTNRMTITRKNK